tara:strand:+ start:86 stop:607 length:522 start_codon:yes stop_codon:yes gene_type:complete
MAGYYEVGASAIAEWKKLGARVDVKGCQLEGLVSIIPDEIKGLLTDYEMAETLVNDPAIAPTIKFEVQEIGIECFDKIDPSAFNAGLPIMPTFKALTPVNVALDERMVRLKGGAKSPRFLAMEYAIAKASSKKSKDVVTEVAKQKIEKKKALGGLPTWAILAGGAGLLYLALR